MSYRGLVHQCRKVSKSVLHNLQDNLRRPQRICSQIGFGIHFKKIFTKLFIVEFAPASKQVCTSCIFVAANRKLVPGTNLLGCVCRSVIRNPVLPSTRLYRGSSLHRGENLGPVSISVGGPMDGSLTLQFLPAVAARPCQRSRSTKVTPPGNDAKDTAHITPF